MQSSQSQLSRFALWFAFACVAVFFVTVTTPIRSAEPGSGGTASLEPDFTLNQIREILRANGMDPDLGFVELDEAELFLEENATDGDLGLHFKVDGEGWKRIALINPSSRLLLDVKVKGNLGREIGLTELFSESSEPSFDDVPRAEFLALFPEGTYLFLGQSLDGPWLVGTPELTHDIPQGVEILSPEEDEEVNPNVDLFLEWLPAPDPDAPDSIIEFYEVVVEKDEDDEQLRVFRVDMRSTDTQVRVPAEFLEPGKDYKVEILGQETSGNRTAIEVPFSTAD